MSSLADSQKYMTVAEGITLVHPDPSYIPNIVNFSSLAMMRDPSLHASEGLEKGSTSSAQKNDGTDIRYTTINPEYTRYLDLHAQFEGDAKRRLLRKRMFTSSQYCHFLEASH
jgi:hypothetical protein